MKLFYCLFLLIPLSSFSQSDSLKCEQIDGKVFYTGPELQIHPVIDSSIYYYVDGIKIYGNPTFAEADPPIQLIEDIPVITNGLIVDYGDFVESDSIVNSDSIESNLETEIIQIRSCRSSSNVAQCAIYVPDYQYRGCCSAPSVYYVEDQKSKKETLFSPYVLTGRSANLE